MRLPHQFAVYTTLRILKPKVLIESGVWRGFVSKLIRKISPDVHIISLDPVCRVEDTSSSNHEIMCGPNFKDFKHWASGGKPLTKAQRLFYLMIIRADIFVHCRHAILDLSILCWKIIFLLELVTIVL